MWRQLSVALFERKVFLMIAHDGHQNFVRQRQKRRIEIPGDHTGKFVEVSDHAAEMSVFMDFEAALFGVGCKFQFNLRGTLRWPHDDAIAFELLLVIRKVMNHDIAGAQEAMATRFHSSGHATIRKFQDLAVENSDDPADRANKARAVETGPGHGARP